MMSQFNDAVATVHYYVNAKPEDILRHDIDANEQNIKAYQAQKAEAWAVIAVQRAREMFFSMWVVLRDDPDENPTL